MCIRDSPSVVQLAGVGLRYGKTVALADIQLDLPAQRMVGPIGPDGVGKSSLLALVSGARALQQGSLQVLGGGIRSKQPASYTHLTLPTIYPW